MPRLISLCLSLLLSIPFAAWAKGPTPDEALQKLIEGNQRFVAGTSIQPNQSEERRREIAEGQNPFAIILGCSDSRVPPKILFDQGLGDLFVVRVAGNTLDEIITGSIEYGAGVLNAPLVLVLGHSKCGAVEAAIKNKPLPGHIEWLANVVRGSLVGSTCDPKDQPNCAIKFNVGWVVKQLRQSAPVLAPLVQAGKLKVVGGYYDLRSGKVEILDIP
ncbi:MAG TPA: carbonic anhydrase [bacterium]|nr:carbonic anhydrase [bacterium]